MYVAKASWLQSKCKIWGSLRYLDGVACSVERRRTQGSRPIERATINQSGMVHVSQGHLQRSRRKGAPSELLMAISSRCR